MSDTKISEACERCGRCREGDFANCKNARNLAEASRDALPFVAYAYSQGIEGAEEAGRAVESALEAAPLHPQPAELADAPAGHELAYAVEKALGNRDGKRDAELDELLAMAMNELNAINTNLPAEMAEQQGVEKDAARWRWLMDDYYGGQVARANKVIGGCFSREAMEQAIDKDLEERR